jgi:hypothetical protein
VRLFILSTFAFVDEVLFYAGLRSAIFDGKMIGKSMTRVGSLKIIEDRQSEHSESENPQSYTRELAPVHLIYFECDRDPACSFGEGASQSKGVTELAISAREYHKLSHLCPALIMCGTSSDI